MDTSSGNITFKNLQNNYSQRKNKYLEEKKGAIKQFHPKKSNLVRKVEEQHQENEAQSRSSEKLDLLVDKINTPLMKLTTMPWLKLFPITVTIDLKKITIDQVNFMKHHGLKPVVSSSFKRLRHLSSYFVFGKSSSTS